MSKEGQAFKRSKNWQKETSKQRRERKKQSKRRVYENRIKQREEHRKRMGRNRFRRVMRKWRAIVAPIHHLAPAELAAIEKLRVHSKVDFLSVTHFQDRNLVAQIHVNKIFITRYTNRTTVAHSSNRKQVLYTTTSVKDAVDYLTSREMSVPVPGDSTEKPSAMPRREPGRDATRAASKASRRVIIASPSHLSCVGRQSREVFRSYMHARGLTRG